MDVFSEVCPITAKDVMHEDVITVSADDTLEVALATLLENGVSGAPVTDSEGHVLGVISEYALMDLLFEPSLKSCIVANHMTRNVHVISEADSVTKLAHLFALYKYRRLPVLRDDRLIGIVSRCDLLKHLIATGTEQVMSPSFMHGDSIEIEDRTCIC